MKKTTLALAFGAAAALLAPAAFSQHTGPALAGPAVIHPEETHLRNLRQLPAADFRADGCL